MRYRALSASNDYVFGQGVGEFLVNTPQAVAQAVATRLRLAQGEWWLDKTEGTPYSTQILGFQTQDLYDQAIKERILDTRDVILIESYSSFLDQDRALSIDCRLNTVYGQATLQLVL